MIEENDPIQGFEETGRKKVRRWIRYESQLTPQFKDEVAREAFDEDISRCIQCGTCSGTCPVSHYMDFTPRRIIAMVREGFKQDVLQSFTIWLCASCYACTVDCPRNIRITDIMYGLKQLALEAGMHPRRFGIPILAQEFHKQVKKNGRNNEMLLVLKLYLKTNVWGILRDSDVGLKLLLRGRIPFRTEKINQVNKLQQLLDKMKDIENKNQGS